MSDELEILKAFSKYTIGYKPVYATICKGVKPGLLLSQLVWHWEQFGCIEFWTTIPTLANELVMSYKEIRISLKKLKSLNFVTVVVKGYQRNSYFIIHLDTIIESIKTCHSIQNVNNDKRSILTKGQYTPKVKIEVDLMAKLKLTKGQNRSVPNGKMLYIKNNTKNSTKTITKTPPHLFDVVETVDAEKEKVDEVVHYYNQACDRNLKGDKDVRIDIKTVLSRFSMEQVKSVIDYIRTDPWHIETRQVTLRAMMRPSKFEAKLDRMASPKLNITSVNPIRQQPGANCNTAPVEDDFVVLRRQKAEGILTVDIPKTPYERLSKEDQEEIDKMREEERKNG